MAPSDVLQLCPHYLRQHDDDGDDGGGDYMTMIRAAQKARVATRVLRGRSLVAATAL